MSTFGQQPQPAKAAPMTREDQAKLEIGVTAIHPAVAWVLAVATLATIFGPPLIQLAMELRSGARPAIAEASAIPAQAVRTFRASAGSLWTRTLEADRAALRQIDQAETALEDSSILFTRLQPRLQSVLTGQLGVGNEKAYVGRNGWLFYRPDVDYVTSPPFFSPRVDELALPSRASVQRTTNPLPAIVDFARQLQARGIRLMIVPTPSKAIIDPGPLSPSAAGLAHPLHNESFARFRAELEAAGVLVFDPSDAMVKSRLAEGKPQFLAADTHWRPEAMDRVAAELALFVNEKVALPQTLGIAYNREMGLVSGTGDLATMLRLPDAHRLYPPEAVKILAVSQPDGQPWSANRSAEILWMGDSFSNIYSVEAMGWGQNAGLAEQVSFHLRRPLDVIARNDNGSFATRQSLSRELSIGKDRLAGKSLVVWQFACRELTEGDWRVLDMSLGRAPARSFLLAPRGEQIVITGTVAARGPVPRTGNIAYSDHIVAVHLTDIERDGGPLPGAEAVVYMWSMKANVLTDAARLRPGQTVTVRMRDWSEVARLVERINRGELDEELQRQPANFGELLPR